MPELSNDPDELAKAIAAKAGLKYEPSKAPDSASPPTAFSPELDYGLQAKPGSRATPIVRAAAAPPVPYRSPEIAANMSPEEVEADNAHEQDLKTGLKVDAYNAQRRAYDRAHGLPVSEPSQGLPAQVVAKPRQPMLTGFAPGFGAPGVVGQAGPSALQKGTQAYLDSLRAQERPMQNIGEAQARQLENEGVAASLRGGERGKQQAEAGADIARFGEDTQRKLGEIAKAREEAANTRIDTNRWSENNAGQLMGLAIAAGFQGFANGLNKIGGNQFIDIIKSKIDADVAAQEKDLESKRGRVGELKGELDAAYRHFGDMQQAKAAMRIDRMQQLAEDAASYGATARSDEVRARAELAQRQLNSEIAKDALGLIPKGLAGQDIRGAIVKRAQELRDKAAANSVDLPIDEARNQATAEVLGIQGYSAQGYAKGAAGAADQALTAAAPAPLTFGERVQNYLGEKGIPGFRNTEGYRKGLEQNAANIPALQAIHKGGVRNVEAQKEVGAPILYNSSDDAETRRFKEELRKRMAKGGKGAEPVPEDFEEEER